MPCRVTAKRRQKKGEKSAFVCVLRRVADWTGKHTASTSNAAYKRENPHISTLITTVISPICPSPDLQKKTEINSDRLWKRATLWCAGSPSIGMWLFRFLIVCTAVSCHALCKVVIHDVAERGKIIVPSGTVYAVIDSDKAHTTLTQDFHNLTDFQIVTPRRLMSFMSRYSTFPASTCFIISKNPGQSKQVPLMPSSVKWVGLEKSCWAA